MSADTRTSLVKPSARPATARRFRRTAGGPDVIRMSRRAWLLPRRDRGSTSVGALLAIAGAIVAIGLVVVAYAPSIAHAFASWQTVAGSL